ncbi:MAG: GNAT family N-acetyltransferase, partial [Chloroflexi bacterium]|nr:GNAT family N-acetyltransferase [Chloroflexota bacterium]
MVAQVASQSKSGFRGARSFEPGHDLNAVARLLEEAFRSDHGFPFSNVPLLRELGIVLWTLSYTPVFPESTTGFVWIEDGQIVGNVSLNPDLGRLDRYMITNVAVKPAYRRQGIARALMQAALDHLRGRAVRTALLNVRPGHSAAIKLYQDLGFAEVELRGEWTLRPPLPAGNGSGLGSELRPLVENDQRSIAELVRAATPSTVQKYQSVRNEFSIAWEERMVEGLGDLIVGQATQRWVLERHGQLAAAILLRAQRLATPHRLTVQVHPGFRGQV